MTKRMLRHTIPKLKAGLLFPAPFVIGYLSGACLMAGLDWGVVHARTWAGAFAITCALALFILALLVATEIDVAYRRWLREQDSEDLRRCVIETCDRRVEKPFAYDRELGGVVCLDCIQRLSHVAYLAGDPGGAM